MTPVPFKCPPLSVSLVEGALRRNGAMSLNLFRLFDVERTACDSLRLMAICTNP
jgi:hypothetical protein